MVSSSGPMKQLHGTEIGLVPPQDVRRYIDLTDRPRFSQPSNRAIGTSETPRNRTCCGHAKSMRMTQADIADGADVRTQRGVGVKLSVVSLWDIPLKNVGRGGLTLDCGEHPCSFPSGTVPRSWGQ
jgi:hypothetical protein